jgi:probable F420-dependent oxidoreductase
MPERYKRLWDPYVALAFIAARTRMTVGTCVSLVGEHDAIALAKTIATLDVQSQGRFVFGVGFGWNEEEFADHGFPASTRWKVLPEKIALMKRLWTDDEGEFAGDFVSVSRSWAWPKPLQRPHPPVLLGARATPLMFQRIAAWADGWIPMSMSPLATLSQDLGALRQAWAAAGRSGAPRVTVMQQPEPVPVLRQMLDDYAALGVERVLIDVPTESAEVLLPLLDAVAVLCLPR